MSFSTWRRSHQHIQSLNQHTTLHHCCNCHNCQQQQWQLEGSSDTVTTLPRRWWSLKNCQNNIQTNLNGSNNTTSSKIIRYSFQSKFVVCHFDSLAAWSGVHKDTVSYGVLGIVFKSQNWVSYSSSCGAWQSFPLMSTSEAESIQWVLRYAASDPIIVYHKTKDVDANFVKLSLKNMNLTVCA